MAKDILKAVTEEDESIQLAHHTGHRDRLRHRFLTAGSESLADYELLELILFSVIPRKDVKPLAKQLIAKFGSFANVLAAEVKELSKVKGLSETSAAHLKVVYAAAKKMAQQQVVGQPVLSSWQSLLDYCHVAMAHETREHFRVLFLNRKNQLMSDEVQQVGTIDHTPVYPREIVKRALEIGATALILAHNHPSGDPTPSKSDIEMTQEIIKAAAALGVAVHDHIIISRSGHISFKAMGLI